MRPNIQFTQEPAISTADVGKLDALLTDSRIQLGPIVQARMSGTKTKCGN